MKAKTTAVTSPQTIRRAAWFSNWLVWYAAWLVVYLGWAALEYSHGYRLRVRPEYLTGHALLGKLLGGLALFDASNYLTIAAHGYVAALPGLKAFFPLWPLVLHLAAWPIGLFASQLHAAMLAATVLNVTFLGLALWVVRRLVLLDYDTGVADRAVLLTLLFPFSFFFLSPYTESLFLLLTVGSFYLARTHRWALATLLAAFASATRLPGVLLAPALLVELLDQSEWRWRKIFPRAFWLPIAPLGALAYFAYLQLFQGGVASYFTAYRVSWPNRHFTLNILAPIFQPLIQLGLHHHMRPNDVLGEASIALAIVAILLMWRYRLRAGYVAFAILGFILPLFSGSLDSLGRYYMASFPVILCLALFFQSRRKLFIAALAASAAASLLLMSAFVAGLFVG